MTQDRDASKEFEQPETQTQLISLQEIEASSREEWLTLAQRLKTEERWGEAIAAYKQALSQEASPDHQNHSGQESSNEEQQTGSSSQSFEQLQAQALTYGQQRQWQACIETCEQALALQPTASLYKLLGDVLQLTGRSSEARRSYREALRLRPDFAEVYGNLGNLYAQERQWPRAIECFQRALRYQPQRVVLHRALAGVWEQVGNEVEAVRCWHRVLGLDPVSGQAQDYFSLGNRWVRLGDWSMAERYYREAIARDEQLTDAWHNLAEVLAHHQNWLSAREMYEQILQREPQRVISRLGYARVLTKLEDWQGAMAEYHRLAESAPEQVLAQQRFAQTLKDQGLLEEAIAVYRRALTFAPNGFELRLGFAELLCEQEQWEDALPQAEAAIALNPQVAQAHYYAGRAQVARANWQAAIPYLEQAVTLDSQFFWSRYFWGEALLGLEDWQGAAAVLDAAMPLNPEYPGGYCHLGLAFLELEQYSEAVQAYRQAIAFGSNDVSYSHLGLALLKLEDWDGAIDVLNRGLELKPDDEEFHWLLSQVFVEKQDWQAAIEAVGRAVALKPEGLEFTPQFKQLLCRQGPLHEAVNDWQQAVDLNRDDPQLQLGLGVALLEGEIHLERAEACLRRNLELQPNQPQGYFYLGKCSAGQGRLDEALGFYRRSWELSQSVDCGLALAEVLQQLGRWSEAIQQYRQVLLECGESGEALFGLGQALAASERPMEAVMEWRRAIGLGWNSPELYRCLAEALVSLERWDEAVLEWGRLLELQPGNALVRRQRALALIGLGRWPESAQEWQQYWQVAPGSGQGTVLDFRPELGMYGEIPHRQELSLTGDLTVEFWLRLREWPQDWTNLVGKFVSDEQNEFCLRLKNGERGQWYYGGGKGCAKPLTWVPQERIRLHQWVHIACVRKLGQSGQLYIDGVLHREQDWGQESGATPTEAPVRLMVSSRLDEFLDGQLSEVRVWNVARTSDEIRRGMSEKLETELGLVAVWSGSEDGIVVDRVADHPGEMKQASANGKPRPQVGVCSGELSQKAVDRADTLAQLYGGFAQVELISSQFPQSEGQVSQPIRETEIPCHRIQAEHEEQFLEQALALVLAHPYEVVHLSQPRMPNIVLGLLYKLLWNARVLVDIDDEELTFVKASEPVDLREFLESGERLPKWKHLQGTEWTRIAVGLVREFDGVTVSNPALQERYGGVVIRHGRDEARFVPSADLKRGSRERFGIAQDKKVVLFFGTPRKHKGLVETAEALASLGRKDVVFAIIGDFTDESLKERLLGISGVDYVFVGNQPFESIPDVVAVGDICVLLQDVGSEVSQFQIPAKLSDALGMGLVVLLSETAAVADVIESGAVVPVAEGDLPAVLDRVLSDEAECNKFRVRGWELLAAEFGFGVNRSRLAAVMDEVRGGVVVLSDELNFLLAGFPAVESVWSKFRNEKKEDDNTKLQMVKTNEHCNIDSVYHRLGEALKQLGRFDEAREAYKKSGKFRTEAAESEFNLSPISPKVSSDYKFKIESANQNTLKGWIVYNQQPNLVLEIDVFIDAVLFATIKNDQVRNDLKRLGISSGLGGFKLNFAQGLFNNNHQITLKVNSGIELASIRIVLNKDKISKCNDYLPFYSLKNYITIIVPIYNAPDDLEVCIERLLKYTTISSKLLFIDDASTDLKVSEILSKIKDYKNIRLLKNEHNLGFTRTINRGIAESGRDDIVLLNSDARVTPRWLEGLRRAVASDPRIGTVTPMSDRAGAFSAPQIGNENDLPPAVTEMDYAVAFRRRSPGFYPTVPTGNGFCMYIRRACIDDVGLFDEKAFPRGYCEENDFCMRAIKLGWRNIMDDRTYIFHDRNKSFGQTKTDLIQAGRSIIDERYPHYKKAIRVFSESPQINLARFRARQAQVDCVESSGILPRALFVIATKTGGTPQTNLDLMAALSDRWETWLLHCDGTILTLSKIVDSQEEIIREHILTEQVEPLYHKSFEYDRVVESWLMEYDFDLVHIRHLLWHSLSLPKLSNQSGAAVVMSFHDFYTVCPTVKLLDENNVFCGGKCTSTDGDCTPDLWPANSLPRLKNAWVKQWRKQFSDALAWCDMFVTTSTSVRETILRELPEIPSDRFHVIPHGRNFSTFVQIYPELKEGEPLRILIPGNISVAKGRNLIKMLLDADKEGKLDFHILGNISFNYQHPRLKLHGTYIRDEFADRVQKIKPHVGAIFSIWNETWCHTLTELWSVGIPAIVFNFPTVAGRVIESGGGWVYEHHDIDKLYNNIVNEVFNVKMLSKKRLAVAEWQKGQGRVNTTYKMSSRYQEVYRQATQRHLSHSRILLAK
nr:tetratricopeptide repeat protein [Sodalinema gerasimenkoae]